MSNVSEMSSHKWKRALTMTEKGGVAKDIGNAVIYLLNDPRWVGCVSYDEFSDRIFWAKAPPALDVEAFPGPRKDDEVSDRDCAYVHHWFARIVGVKFSIDTLLRAIEVAAHQNKVCPPRDYLRGVKWDGVPRLATMFSKYFAAVQSTYTEKVGRWWMISAVARMLEPGCKADCILILQGKQGSRKSSALGVLGGKWYSNSLPDVTSKDAQVSLFGSWIVEIPELEAMNRSATTAFKDFSARSFDKFRKPYGRFDIINQRRCVFAGTTNDDKVLSDPTGARRFWPVHVATDGQSIDLAALARDRDQLWAEAVHEFDGGYEWWVTPEMEKVVAAEQDDRYIDDIWSIRVASWLEREEQSGKEDFTASEVLTGALNVELPKQDIASGIRISKIMRRLNYRSSGRRTVGGRKFAVYRALESRLVLQPPREPGEDDE